VRNQCLKNQKKSERRLSPPLDLVVNDSNDTNIFNRLENFIHTAKMQFEEQGKALTQSHNTPTQRKKKIFVVDERIGKLKKQLEETKKERDEHYTKLIRTLEE